MASINSIGGTAMTFANFKSKAGLIRKAAIFAAFLLLTIAKPVNLTQAATQQESSFSVTTNQNTYQRNTELPYFDLLMGPGKTTTLSVNVINNDEATHRYTISINRAVTNTNTIIDYGQTKSEPMVGLNQKFNMTSIVSPRTQKITIPGHQQKVVKFKVTMPKITLKGVLLGGVHVRQEIEKKEESGYTNRFNFVTTLLMRQSNKSTKANLRLNKVSVTTNNIGVINASLTNTTAAYLTDLTIKSSLFNANNSEKVIAESKQKARSVAPNTKFNYQLPLRKRKLKSGHYILDLTIVSKKTEQTWHWRQTFTISDKDANDVMRITEYYVPTPWWIWVLIGLGVLLLLILLLILWLLFKRRKHDNDDQNESSSNN
ncbi:DUF916 and DUF3324 domain-containing protein [Lacticaseibacillus paracasei]|uniref:DUF916 and DUF3324 domain-containing protein n=1 Tax=Lacticaseibacillus paracasei TaxID=1597 RepID=UPI0018C4D71A|nr:DUF916 and DUF3324 domain-containing protein [Lacticaseibacillus paracasei]